MAIPIKIEYDYKIRITPKPEYMGYGYDFRLIDSINRIYAERIIVHQVSDSENGIIIPSLFTMTNEQVQALMNELWNLGIRPSNGAGDNNAFESVKYHLEDMRRLVFKDKK